MGALKNWVALQSETNLDGTPTYDCYFFIADYHALTTDYADTSKLQQNVRDVALDFLSAGLDPALCTLFIQSHVPAHFELNDLLAMITPLSWLERVPSYKDQQEQLKEKDLATFGFLGYPLLQSADILAYQPDFVPVGQDQAAHVEFTRELARRFNYLYSNRGFKALAQLASQGTVSGYEALARLGASSSTGFPAIGALLGNADQPLDEKRGRLGSGGYPDPADTVPARSEILPEPKVLLTPSPKLPGTDGRKMSKSYNNTILLSDPEPDIRAKLKTMVTDPARIRRDDPGNPDICPVFDLHKVFSTETVQAEAAAGCRSAKIGCIECKGWVADAIVERIAPIQAHRRDLEHRPQVIKDVLANGSTRAAKRAQQTLEEVQLAMGLA
jgi:tryptophanyl-tRNA synthetase